MVELEDDYNAELDQSQLFPSAEPFEGGGGRENRNFTFTLGLARGVSPATSALV